MPTSGGLVSARHVSGCLGRSRLFWEFVPIVVEWIREGQLVARDGRGQARVLLLGDSGWNRCLSLPPPGCCGWNSCLLIRGCIIPVRDGYTSLSDSLGHCVGRGPTQWSFSVSPS